MCVIYQDKRMTTSALIVNHWQHYWASPPSPIWVCIGKWGGCCYKSVNYTQECVHTKHGNTNLLPTSHWHTHTDTLEMIINVLITRLWQELRFSCVDHPLCQFCLPSSILIMNRVKQNIETEKKKKKKSCHREITSLYLKKKNVDLSHQITDHQRVVQWIV